MSKNTGNKDRDPVAIIGIGCRLPGGANSPEEFWKLLLNGTDAITKIPSDRWNADALYNPDYTKKGKINVREGGFVNDIDKIDAGFFEIPPIEAARLDPQQRLLLEVTYQAIEDAGLKLDKLSGSKTGVFIGISSHDYGEISTTHTERANIGGSTNLGNAGSIASNRISYIFNLKGPSFSIDSACSSSLNALHVACRSIWSGEADAVIAGGVNIILKPEIHMGFSKGGFLAPDGRCKAFDARANGYVRSEGAGVVILKPLSRALEDGDNIYATIIGSAVNQDGRTTGIPMPNLDSQISMLKAAYKDAGVSPEKVQYIEAHGTGTKIGDFTEGTAIGTVLGKYKKHGEKLLVGSVKTNIGHLEAGSGAAGIIKLALTLKNGKVPPNVHFETPNPKIPFKEYNIQIPVMPMELSINGSPVYAGINSFGFGGANAHIVLQAPPKVNGKINKKDNKLAKLFVISAKTPDALKALVNSYIDFIEKTENSLIDICYSAATRRSNFDYRLSIASHTKEEIIENMKAYLNDEARIGMNYSRKGLAEKNKVAFVYSGQGPQWWAMGRQLLKEEPVFKNAILEIGEILKNLGWLKDDKSTLIEELSKDEESSRINETHIAQPAIFAVQVALTKLWESYGITADGIVGHSIGEVAASYVCGALSLDEATRVVYWRSKCQTKAEGLGKMLAVGLPEKETAKWIKGYEGKVCIAVINGPKMLTLAGDSSALEELEEKLTKDEIFNRFVKVSIPFHSHYMDPIKEEFLSNLGKIQAKKEIIPVFSTVTGEKFDGKGFDANYWFRNIRETVQFYPAVKKMLKDGYNVIIEISPHPILSRSIMDTFQEIKKKGRVVPTLRRKEDEKVRFLGSIGELFTWGYNLEWEKIFSGNHNFVKLPYYQMQKERFWIESEELRGIRIGDTGHPHLGEVWDSVNEKDGFIWDIILDKRVESYIEDHRVQGPIIYPGAGHVELGLSVARTSFKDSFEFLENINFNTALFLPDDGEMPYVRIEILSNEGDYTISTKPRDYEAQWSIHSNGRINHCGDAFISEKVDLKDVQKRIHPEVEVKGLYDGLLDCGLHLGPTFRAMKRLWRNDTEALAEIHVHEDIKSGFEKFNIHPAILDACFQTLFGVMYKGTGKWDLGVFIPVHIKRVKFYRKPGTFKLWSYGRLIERSEKYGLGSFWIFDDDGNIVAEIQELSCQYIEGSRGESEDEINNCFYEYQWKMKALPEDEKTRDPGTYIKSPLSIQDEMKKFVKKIVDMPIHSEFLNAFDPELDNLSIAYIVKALRDMDISLTLNEKLNPDELFKKCSIVSRHNRLFTHMINALTGFGYLKKTESGWLVIKEPKVQDPNQMLNEMMGKYHNFIRELVLVQRCGPYLKDVVQGNCDPIQLIFPENEWDAVVKYYVEGHSFKMYNDMTQFAITQLLKDLPEEQNIRIIEIGAGTGGMSQAVLSVLPVDRTEYVYTDLSPMFLQKAKERFSKYQFIQYDILDIEKDIEAQGFELNSFDIVIASDVVHATRNITKTLSNIQQLLSYNGLLIMLEVSKSPLYLDIIFGMTEGWWLFEDKDLRPNHATMLPPNWVKVLKQVGFDEIITVTDVEKNDKASQTVFFGRNKKEIEIETGNIEGVESIENETKPGKWIVFKDSLGVADKIIKQLNTKNKTCYTVNIGESYQDNGNNDYNIDIKKDGDIANVISKITSANDIPLEGIIHLFSIDNIDNKDLNTAKLVEAQLSSKALIEITNAVSKMTDAPKLWIITNGSQNIESFENKSISLAETPIWGVARVIFNEIPDLYSCIIDLSRNPEDDEINNLVKEFWSEKKEEEIALRSRKRYLNVLSRVSPVLAKQLAEKKVPGIGHAYHTSISEYGVLDNLLLEENRLSEPASDEVQIEVYASALNFRDVMIAMGMLSDEAVNGGLYGKRFGLECSGIIKSIGKDVNDYKPGDEVIAFAPDCLGGLANAKASIIVKKPNHLSFQEAATIPIVYLTAYYSLNYLCRMSKGEKILIHAGTGGVGLAAISLAKHTGVEIFATAGNDKKREYLRSLGVKHVFNSRALDFKDRIMEITDGKGVDIVLNSISGKAMHQNIQCLAPYGRVVEIGKTDIYQNTRIGLKPFGNNLAYFAVDIDRLLLQKTELAGKQFKEVIKFFNNKTFNAHPYHEYSISNVSDAFLFLSQSRHIGKVVVSMNEKEVNVSPASSMEFKNDGSYLIIGGCSGLGLAIAEWMSNKGAGNLVLMSRSGAKNEEDKQKIKDIEDSGTGVAVVTGDVSNEADIKKVIKQIKDDMPALKGVIHSALVLDDAPLEEMTHERFMKAVNPKMLGTWNLHIATLDIPLDFFVMFSSISSIYGNPGQSNYAASNAFLDKLSFYRRALGLPANTINWGVIGEVGFVARTQKVNNILSSRGWQSFSLIESIGIFEKMLLQNFPQRMAAKIVWEEIGKFFGHSINSTRFGHLFDEKGSSKGSVGSGSLRETIMSVEGSEQEAILRSSLKDSIARVLGTSGEKIDENTKLTKMGLDSLMSNQVRNWVQGNLGIDYSLMKIMQGPTINEMTEQLLSEIRKVGKKESGAVSSEIEKWTICYKENPDAKIRLFCFSQLGAGASKFNSWAEELPDSIELYAIQLPGREERLDEEAVIDNDELKAILKEVILQYSDKPFAFFGHSFGGGVCSKLAYRLQNEHDVSPEHVFVASSFPPNVPNPIRKLFENVELGNGNPVPEDLIVDLLRATEMPEAVLSDLDMIKDMMPAIKADIILMKNDDEEIETLTCPITAFNGKADKVFSSDAVSQWKEYSGNGFIFKEMKGGHLFLEDTENRKYIIEQISKTLLK